METTLAVSGPGDDMAGASNDLRRWLRRHPDLRDRVVRDHVPEPPPEAMGATGELVSLLLAPGGLTAALAAAVVAWLQNRRGSQTVTITLPDGTQVVVSSERVRDLDAAGSGELAQRVAEALERRTPATGDRTQPDSPSEPDGLSEPDGPAARPDPVPDGTDGGPPSRDGS
ncbi:effector-associated constant component EACC1 [Streptomyces sp. SID1121]|uniref:effector-associated constant component EACC1 n=1 Tax=Streptomyces sp. SID1121 TaxID=3425888 RepID=UPI004055E00C